MKVFAIAAILAALYLLYRIAYPNKQENKKANEVSPKRTERDNEIVGKSRVVLSSPSQTVPSYSTYCESNSLNENTNSFAGGNQIKSMEIYVPLDSGNGSLESEIDLEEEIEQLRQTLGNEIVPANGLTYEEMELAVNELSYPSEANKAKVAEVLFRMENTEYVTQLSDISPEKAEQIKDLINQYVKSIEAKEDKSEDTGDFEITRFLS
jgi:hypothetical protein